MYVYHSNHLNLLCLYANTVNIWTTLAEDDANIGYTT